MSHITLAQQGLAAVQAKDWDKAVDLLSKALQSSPNPAWLVARSKALAGLQRFQQALDDADVAWHAAHERGMRAAMVDAHYRRAVAYFRMGQYANADCCCVYAMRLVKGFPAVETEDPKERWTGADGCWTATFEQAMDEARVDDFNRGCDDEKGAELVSGVPEMPRAQVSEWRLASTLRMQALNALNALAPDDAARKVTVSLQPEKKDMADAASASGVVERQATPQPEKDLGSATNVDGDRLTITMTLRPAPVPHDAPPRLQEFQSTATMSVSIFSKGVSQDTLKVEFLPDAVHLDPLVYPSGEKKEFRLHLWDLIDPSASKYTVTPNKVELSLAKKTPGKWPQLRKDEAAAGKAKASDEAQSSEPQEEKTDGDDAEASSAKPGPSQPTMGSAPAYPSSSRYGPKDWDKIGNEEAEEEEENDVNMFFKKLYKNCTPEQQRAMMKSYTESSGTSLSTDWESVKDRTVETVPPEGVEAKKWE